MNRSYWLPAILAFLGVGAYAWAQSRIIADQGTPGNYGAWPVTTSGTSGVATYPLQCVTVRTHKNTSVTNVAANTPSAQATSRKYIQLCNSLQNAGNPIVKCRADGTAPVHAAGNPGDVLGVGDCVLYPIANTVVPQCISDAAGGANVTSFECG